MSVSFWQDKSANSEVVKCDVVIIGAGVAGLSTAYWLAKEDPSLNICIVEKYSVGSGASGRNAGFITCGSVEHFNRLVETHGDQKALEIWRFSEQNLELLKNEIILDNEEELLFEHEGSFSLASECNELKELKKSASLMQSMNIDVEVLNEQEIAKRLGVSNFSGGIKYSLDACINPISLLNQIKSKLPETVKLYDNHEVFSLELEQDLKIVKTPHRHFKASIIVLATNAYSALIHPYFKDKILPTRGQIMSIEPVPRFMEGPCYANFVLDYFRQLPTGELIIGGFRQLQKDVEKGYSDETTTEIQHALETFVKTHIPALSKSKITHRWSGIMGFSSDGQPMVGALSTDPQVFFLGGFTAHGLGLAFHSAKCLTDIIFGRGIPSFISAKRF